MARLYERYENHALYSPSSQKRIELSRNYHTQYLLLKLTVNHDNAAGATFKDEALFGLINQLEVIANGNQTIKQIPSKKLYLDNIIGTSQRGMHSIDTSEGAGKESFVYAVIPFSMFNTIRPHDTILNTALFTTFDLLINWGGDSSIGSGITVNNAKLDVWSSSLINYKRNANETISFFNSTSLLKEVTSTTNELTISLPTQKLYKSIQIVSTVDGKRVDNMIKGVKIKSGNTTFVDIDANALRAKNVFEFKPEAYNLLKGCYVVDFTIRGRMTDLLDTINSYNTLEVVLDVEKQPGETNNVHILTDTVQKTNILEK
ncbi:hypothetical protein AMRN_1422 [Malaciobacter marinus]|uniref:Uncharacterized protein n=1 Tax=Malaciobacter marinus TaxID=505249 RepID=A0A347TKN0_9BACT|nr:hypothetical protein [Malaciobacter marinus]AXX87158.1 hypothetical protein AMRN_1422 [Malaciobacter marinus]PHO14821.1 hypothetical protein CPH92_09550 [Malaciobacter marinus]